MMQAHDELVLKVPGAELDLLKVELPRFVASVLDLAEVAAEGNWQQAHCDVVGAWCRRFEPSLDAGA
jgi:DNA polymerase I